MDLLKKKMPFDKRFKHNLVYKKKSEFCWGFRCWLSFLVCYGSLDSMLLIYCILLKKGGRVFSFDWIVEL